jgi:UDP-N-acetylglucosamine--N-acetylmuramyl-(pentapeptide) pyrophosphoryl-undecaprenol N-acetylglucosamine transferase
MGGSQGALGLNRMVRAVLPELLELGCRVVHLTGSNYPDVGELQHSRLVECRFSDDIPGLLQHADLAISRAGAGSLSELAVCGTPSILVPFPQAADQHQDANAACASELSGAVIVHQHAPDHAALGNCIRRLLGGRLGDADARPELLEQMRAGMDELAKRDADAQLARLLTNLLH